jgi:EAL domain-containing protein (putative c-di-GMP-specific phosphodiesterase class I)
LSYLKKFPIDTLKVDRSFIRDVIASSDDAAIVKAIVALAQSLKLNIVAEGVEDAAQLSFLNTLGCDEYQGYYFSRPLPPADIADLLHGKVSSEINAVGQTSAREMHSEH